MEQQKLENVSLVFCPLCFRFFQRVCGGRSLPLLTRRGEKVSWAVLKKTVDYFNRKLFYSIHFQAIWVHCGHFLDVHMGFPGCAHDAWVLRCSLFYVHQLCPPPGWWLIVTEGISVWLNPLAWPLKTTQCTLGSLSMSGKLTSLLRNSC